MSKRATPSAADGLSQPVGAIVATYFGHPSGKWPHSRFGAEAHLLNNLDCFLVSRHCLAQAGKAGQRPAVLIWPSCARSSSRTGETDGFQKAGANFRQLMMRGRAQAKPEKDRGPRPLPDRKSQKARSARTRDLLREAAIECLSQHGYGMTTTTLIAEIAGVSRGAMLHQFPSKADLMIFVVESIFEEQTEYYRERLRAANDKRQRLLAYPEAVWASTRRPSGIAMLEIFQGSRSDQALAAKLRPVQARIDAIAIASLTREFNREPSVAMFQLIVGAARGLALGEVIAPAGQTGEDAIRLLRELLEAAAGTRRPDKDLNAA